jgi:hypothetical protein
MRTYLAVMFILTVILVPLFGVDIAQGVSEVYPKANEGTFTVDGTVNVGNTITTTGFGMTAINGVATAGDTTVVSVAGGSTIKVFRYDFKPDQNITGTVNLQVGATNTYSINNSLADNVYGENLIPNFYEGASGENLVVNTPDAVRYNIMYKVE